MGVKYSIVFCVSCIIQQDYAFSLKFGLDILAKI